MAKRVTINTTVTATVKEQWVVVVPDDFDVNVDNALDLLREGPDLPSIVADVDNVEVYDEFDRTLDTIDPVETPASDGETRRLDRHMRREG